MATFRFRYDPVMKAVAPVLGMGQGRSGVEVSDGRIRVRMGWAFTLEAAIDDVTSAEHVRDESLPRRLIAGIGVHGLPGRWRVNGATTPIVRLRFKEPQRARALGLPVKVGQLDINPEDPEAFLLAIGYVD